MEISIVLSETIAVVGASNNPEKFGYKVVQALKEVGAKIYPVNPKAKEILGLRTYEKLSEIEAEVGTVVFIVPPAVAFEVMNEVVSLGIKRAWFQPGSESKMSEAFCKMNDVEYEMSKCIIVEANKVSITSQNTMQKSNLNARFN